MTPEAFRTWLVTMKIRSAEAARLLQIHANTVTKYKARGAPKPVALACAALYHRIEPWK